MELVLSEFQYKALRNLMRLDESVQRAELSLYGGLLGATASIRRRVLGDPEECAGATQIVVTLPDDQCDEVG